MLSGDAEKQAEQAMLAENSEDDLRVDVLKVGHHGSKGSTTEEFLEAVPPQVARNRWSGCKPLERDC